MLQNRDTQSDLSARDTLVFDLDNTLYPASCRLFDQVDERMTQYVAKLLDLDTLEARRIQKQYFYDHGTTLQGLLKNHDVNPKEFLDFVHDIDTSPIPQNHRLVTFLENFKGRKVIFTNGCKNHMRNILTHLQILHLFEGSFDIVDAEYLPKPNKSIYPKMLKMLEVDPTRAIMFEDIPRNLEPAAELGMATVLVTEGMNYDPEYKHLHSKSYYETGNDNFIQYKTSCLTSWLEENL